MKTKLAMTAFVVAALCAPAIGYGADDHDKDRDHPTAFVKDSAITTKIKAKLAAENVASLAKIHVDTDANGMVWLTGTASSQQDVDKAVAIARGTEDVRGVTNKLTVKKD